MYRFGGYFSILSSLCHMVMGVVLVFQPIIIQESNVDIFLSTLSKEPLWFVLSYLFTALIAFLGLGIVDGITSFLKVQKFEIVIWAKKLAYIGFAVSALSYFRALTMKPMMASVYLAASDSQKEIIRTVDPYISFSPNGIVIYGFVGLWLIMINILSLFHKKCLHICKTIGILLGGAMIIMTVPALPSVLFSTFNIIRGVLSFVWFGLIGIYMLKSERANINRFS